MIDIDPIYIVYLFVALAAGLLAEAVYLLFFTSHSYRKNVNRRLNWSRTSATARPCWCSFAASAV